MTYLLHDVLDQANEQFPNQEAVRCSGQSITYSELKERANQLANVLIARGVKRSDRVGILVSKSLESAVAIYGILKAGAAYVPLDAWMPTKRLRYVLLECGIRHLVTDPSRTNLVRRILSQGSQLECLIGASTGHEGSLSCLTWNDVYSQAPADDPSVSVGEQDLAYILYTSGSTGQPKGIMHSHQSGLTFVNWATETYDLRPQDRISNHAPLHFDLSIFDFIAAAKVGATTCVVPEETSKMPASLSRWIADERITVWYSVPVALTQLLLRGAIEAKDVVSLRWVLFGGEPFPTKYLRQVMNLAPNARFSHVYGVTETNVSHYYHLSDPPDESEETMIPIGRLCASMEALILNDEGQPIGVDAVGELVLRGPAMMLGYWGRPGLPDLDEQVYYRPASAPNHEHFFYRTGDLALLQSDENYRFMGRKDRQVKTRGHRVELDEIEAALTSHDDVEEAAVFPTADGEGSTRIMAAVKLSRGKTTNGTDLTAYLRRSLPSYAVPTLVPLDQIPRTTAGKIDRRTLESVVGQEIDKLPGVRNN